MSYIHYTQKWQSEITVKNVLNVSLNNTAGVKALSVSCPTHSNGCRKALLKMC